ncbi:MAG: rRNA pseudouridine synthase [Kiritimatiellae bacterium]|nr:rRNA pseudouridine synthase [Kiritimatiellia bacterium]
MAAEEETIRLQKYLEQCGVGSRRSCGSLIETGAVAVEGKRITIPGYRIPASGARITINGIPLDTSALNRAHRTIMLYKPRGLICSCDDGQGATIYDCLDGVKERVVPIGRLDKDSEGLLLLSDDGDLINRLTHPKFNHRKEYIVEVAGVVNRDVLDLLRSRMVIDGYRIQPAEVEYIECERERRNGQQLHIMRFILVEGRNLQIRKMCAKAGLRVLHLMRVAINDLQLPEDMHPGEWRDLSATELALLG